MQQRFKKISTVENGTVIQSVAGVNSQNSDSQKNIPKNNNEDLQLSADYLFYNIFDETQKADVLIPKKKKLTNTQSPKINQSGFFDLGPQNINNIKIPNFANFAYILRYLNKISPLEFLAYTILFIGLLVFSSGIIKFVGSAQVEEVSFANPIGEDKATTNYTPPIIGQAIASVQPANQTSPTFLLKEVYPKLWTNFVEDLQKNNHPVLAVDELHPRLQLLQLALGTEINLLLTPNDNHIEEIQLRINLLTANKPFIQYHSIITDLNKIISKNDLGSEEQFIQKLALPVDLYKINLPYSATYQSSQIIAEVNIDDPLYIVFRIKPNSLRFENIAKAP